MSKKAATAKTRSKERASEEAEKPRAADSGLPSELLDRMTGRLGTDGVLRERGRQYQLALAPALEDALHTATGLEIDVRPSRIRTGRRRELLDELSPGMAYCEGAVRGWSLDLAYLCGSPIVIALVECLLGGADPGSIESVSRPLSGIELDMSLVVFEQINDMLKAAVSDSPKARASVGKPLLVVPPDDEGQTVDFHAAAIGFELEFATVTAPLYLIAPQAVLLKTKPRRLAKRQEDEVQAQKDWKERLSRRVVGSEVRLEARIALDPLKLADVSRLRPGDMLAFSETEGTQVTLGANGKDLYSCALGRAGQRYMVRIEGPAAADEDWRDELA